MDSCREEAKTLEQAFDVGIGTLELFEAQPRRDLGKVLCELGAHAAQQFEFAVVESQQTGVQTVVHNHSGLSMGLNSSSVMNLVKGFDAKHIGVFADPGHLSICGEPIDLALNIVKDYLSVLAFKDLIRERVQQNGKTTWRTKVVRLGHGFGDWDNLLNAMDRVGFDGPISFHSEYSGEPVETVIDLARADVRFMRGLMGLD